MFKKPQNTNNLMSGQFLLLIIFVCDVQSVLNKKSKPQKF